MNAIFRQIFSHILLIFMVPFVLGIPLSILSGLKRRKKQLRLLNDYVSKRNYHFLESMKMGTDGLVGIREFTGPRSGTDGFFFNYLGQVMTIFEHCKTVLNGANSQPIFFRAAKLPQTGLPEFRLEKAGAVAYVEQAVGKILEATGAPTGVHKVDFPDWPLFSKRYMVFAKAEEGVKPYFTDRKIAYFESNAVEGTVATNSEYVVYFELGKFSDEASYDDFISRAKIVFEHLLK